MQVLSLLFFMSLTIGAYLFSRRLYMRYNHPLLNPVLLSMSIVIATLLICNIPYERYAPASKIISFLLGPATVGLAVPLYRKRELLRN